VSTDDDPLMLRRLLPAGDRATVDEAIDGLTLGEWTDPSSPRPRVLVNMISTADGRASVGGRSGPIGNRADREVFHGLRGRVDAVLVGAGTVRAERYGRIVPDERRRKRRLERGLTDEPLACIVSGRLSLPSDIPLLAQPDAKVVIVTAPAAGILPPMEADVQYIRAEHDGQLDLTAALAELRERFAVRTLLCEGGPHLNLHLLAAGLVDELFLSLAPKLAGGSPGGHALRILAGEPLEDLVELELLSALESDSQLFLRYRVCASSPD
jgi:riboflavin-specific deaminase-like protein